MDMKKTKSISYLDKNALPARLVGGQYLLLLEHDVDINHTFVIAQQASVQVFVLYLGAVTGQVNINYSLEEEAALEVQELGLFTHDSNLSLAKVYEAGTSAHSTYTVKHVMLGKGRVADDSRVYIPQHAQKSSSYLDMKAYLLAPNGQARITPGLDVIANDVKAGHKGTVERFDPDTLYYLGSRGINHYEAQHLLLEGIIQDYVGHMSDAHAQSEVIKQLDHLIQSTQNYVG
jgi:Fe-S cluster assembly protein SufD